MRKSLPVWIDTTINRHWGRAKMHLSLTDTFTVLWDGPEWESFIKLAKRALNGM
jgi:hypothetical protein